MKSINDIEGLSTTGITFPCNDYHTQCGCSLKDVVLTEEVITNTEESIPHSWAMTVSIRLNDTDEHTCTGTILSSWFIMTAASCIDNTVHEDISILAGTHNRQQDFPTIRYVTNVFIHPGWNRSNIHYENDVALLRIFPPLNIIPGGFTARTCPSYVIFPEQIIQHPVHGSRLVVVSWKSIQFGYEHMSDVLQQATLSTIANDDPICQQTGIDLNKQFCAETQTKSMTFSHCF